MDDLCPDTSPTEMGVLENRLSVDALEYRIDLLERKVRRQARIIDTLLKQSSRKRRRTADRAKTPNHADKRRRRRVHANTIIV